MGSGVADWLEFQAFALQFEKTMSLIVPKSTVEARASPLQNLPPPSLGSSPRLDENIVLTLCSDAPTAVYHTVQPTSGKTHLRSSTKQKRGRRLPLHVSKSTCLPLQMLTQ